MDGKRYHGIKIKNIKMLAALEWRKRENMNEIKKYKTCELVKEIKEREGVTCQCAEPYQNKEITVNGPAIVLIITD